MTSVLRAVACERYRITPLVPPEGEGRFLGRFARRGTVRAAGEGERVNLLDGARTEAQSEPSTRKFLASYGTGAGGEKKTQPPPSLRRSANQGKGRDVGDAAHVAAHLHTDVARLAPRRAPRAATKGERGACARSGDAPTMSWAQREEARPRAALQAPLAVGTTPSTGRTHFLAIQYGGELVASKPTSWTQWFSERAP